MKMNAMKRSEAAQPWLEYGTVVAAIAGAVEVRTAFGVVAAERAAGCFLAPRPGDEVLLAVDEAGGGFVLSVLRQASPGTELDFEGPVALRVRQGDLTLAAEGGIGLASERLDVAADRGRVRLGVVSFLAGRLESEVSRIKSVARSVDAVVRRLTQRLGSSFRFVEEHDETQARTQRVLVEDLMTLHSKNAHIVSEEHVTVNAEQINLG